ncbi:PNK3P-domain-containing protein [Macrolepiota fuliginosa MF-IS2]|uniref:PNK3P-domain-containing protein n=1 Tax=Macrolepiota fuliginosa MF-IS2 TaxID=1400762 RepID=A0A9P6C5D9_9AGAR|nr:PNK3P-domain-containing protein [Macrolepiota fuliginosa MF-IS2]
MLQACFHKPSKRRMQAGPSKSLKRSAQEPPPGEPAAKKIHPFFTKDADTTKECSGPFRWLTPLGKSKTCLNGINLQPKCGSKVAAFDLDGTIIKFLAGDSDWEWWNPVVPTKLRDIAQEGYSIVFLSNQAIKPKQLKQWKEKVSSIASALDGVPFRIFAATAKDGYRKPMLGMWWELERILLEQGVKIDFQVSFFVGDAAGRRYKNRKSDFSSTDRKFALNIGISFMTPEEYFLNLPAHLDYTLPGFHVSSLQDLPLVTPTSSPIIPHPRRQEIVVFCGYPALGKTRFYRQHFQPADYTHINQDTLKTRDKCIKAAREALKRGESCVIDNTNRDIKTRKYYIELKKEFRVEARCFVFTGNIELAWHNNLFRAFQKPPSVVGQEAPRDLVPYAVFVGFRDQYEEPTTDEGFLEIRKVNWNFEGTDEEKRNWSMWLQIDGT